MLPANATHRRDVLRPQNLASVFVEQRVFVEGASEERVEHDDAVVALHSQNQRRAGRQVRLLQRTTCVGHKLPVLEFKSLIASNQVEVRVVSEPQILLRLVLLQPHHPRSNNFEPFNERDWY